MTTMTINYAALRKFIAKATPVPWRHYDEVFRRQFSQRRITEIAAMAASRKTAQITNDPIKSSMKHTASSSRFLETLHTLSSGK